MSKTERPPAARSDPVDLQEAFEVHAPAILRLCLLVTGRQDAAEDLVQETFVRAAGKLGSVAPEAVRSYLRRTAMNLWNSRLRRLRLERRMAHQLREEPVVGGGEQRHEVWQAVLTLPPRQRAIVVLRYFEDMTERDTAAALGCAVGTVKSQANRALAKLRMELGDED